MMPLVSVITPARNAGTFLRRCHESVRRQTYGNWEHIIIDDCSADDTWCVIQDISSQDDRVKGIRSEAQLGPGRARNRGIEMATGEYIALLDADDLATEDRLALQ